MNKHEVTTKNILEEMTQAVVDGDEQKAASLADQTSMYNLSPLKAIEEGFVRGIKIVGQKYDSGEFYLPELITAGEAMKRALEILEPQIKKEGTLRDKLGRVVIGAVEGDVHDIGKTIVATMLYVNGFEVFDLGINVTSDAFINKIKEVEADILGMSALLSTTMVNQDKTIKALVSEGLRDKVKVMIGGAPTSQRLCDRIGADGYGENAAEAVEVLTKLVSGRKG